MQHYYKTQSCKILSFFNSPKAKVTSYRVNAQILSGCMKHRLVS